MFLIQIYLLSFTIYIHNYIYFIVKSIFFLSRISYLYPHHNQDYTYQIFLESFETHRRRNDRGRKLTFHVEFYYIYITKLYDVPVLYNYTMIFFIFCLQNSISPLFFLKKV